MSKEDLPVQFVNQKYNQKITKLTQLDPAYLIIYANDLFEKGQKDDALFWFYVAQYRALIVRTMENEKSSLSKERFQQLARDAGTPVIGNMVVIGSGLNRNYLYYYIHSGIGPFINDYAGSNMDNWIVQLEKVLAFEKEHPFDPFQAIPADQLTASKEPEARKQAAQMEQMLTFLKQNKSALEQQRKQLQGLKERIKKLQESKKKQNKNPS